jgi:hypothetical protein
MDTHGHKDGGSGTGLSVRHSQGQSAGAGTTSGASSRATGTSKPAAAKTPVQHTH